MKQTIATVALAAMLLTGSVALAAAPVCGDVNNSGDVLSSDALLVLRKSVSQPITLDCSAYDDQFSACETSLAGASADLTTCNADLTTTNSDLGTCQGELADVAKDLAAYQPAPCPCWSGPALLAEVIVQYVTGTTTTDWGSTCQFVNGANTHYFGLRSDASVPDGIVMPIVSNDGKCFTAMGVQVNYMQGGAALSCDVSQNVMEIFLDHNTQEWVDDTADCAGVPRFSRVMVPGLSQAQLDACSAQIPVAASLIPACVP